MRKLTESQITYLKSFFGDVYQNISDKLLRNGKCVVAGDGKLWHGGIGNFIRITDAEDFVDCKQLNFDVDEFLSSEWFKGSTQHYIERRELEIEQLRANLIDIKLLKI
jgi:hypothetical protein